MFFPLALLFLLVIFAAGVAVLSVRLLPGSTTARRVFTVTALSMCGVAALLVLLLVSMRARAVQLHHAEVDREVMSYSYQVAQRRQMIEPVSAPAWLNEVDEQFDADTYPSVRVAAQALGRRTLILLKDVAGEAPPEVFQIAQEQVAGRSGRVDRRSTIPAEAAADLSEVLRKALPDTRVLSATSMPPGPRIVSIRLRIPSYSLTRSGHGVETVGGALRAIVEGSSGSASVDTRFLEKLWLSDYTRFSALTRRPWLIARSQGFANSAAQAEQDACDTAGRLLADTMKSAGTPVGAYGSVTLPDDLALRLAAEMRGGRMVADRFVQRLSRPYGDVWRAAILVDPGNDGLVQVLNNLRGAQHRHRASLFVTGFSLVALVGCIVVIYLFLNMATKGYYEWALRIASFVIIAGGLLFVLSLRW
ncbi:MAG: hypothetical protein CMJ18_07525 [Phycisphaeraceae bacterium]|nr:hypothetical protein [Phycisphaeraceae bacterium]